MGLLDIPTDAAVNQVILIFGSSYLLFDGGASLRFKVLNEVWISIVVLATMGVLVTALITSVAANYVLGIPYIVALLLGAAIASTDPATLVPIFRQVRIRDRVAQTVVELPPPASSLAPDLPIGGSLLRISACAGRLGSSAFRALSILRTREERDGAQ